MRKNSIFRLIAILLCVFAMLCIWPLGVFGRTIDIDSITETEWKTTEQKLECGKSITQSFVAKTNRLQYIAFSVETEGDFLKEDMIRFELTDSAGNNLLSENIPLMQIECNTYYFVPIEKWIKKGKEYTFSLSVDKEPNGIVRGIYTDCYKENVTGASKLEFANVELYGETQTRYGYVFPMNVKNVICIWAFFLTICFSICKMIEGLPAKDEENIQEDNEII